MYDFDSGLWTTLDVAPHWGIYCSSSSVSLKGNSYWCATERSSEGCKDRIICFDFTKERFGPLLPLPSCVRDRQYAYVHLSCVKEEKIAALFYHHYDFEFEIWITTKIEAETVSWSKFLRIDSELGINSPDCFFIDEEKKGFMCVGRYYGYDSEPGECPKPFIKIIGEAGYSKDFDLGVPAYKNSWLDNVCSYVPSLVQIKKLARGKRI
ncbi:PREDICTED: putative F-box protein At5g41510 [Camelina sativa]|nr:PREDICTED: putative F-box protein At5g41510 [Camelina sativa]XP_019099919.1 PREDICTED: putative F-box protein At5g41510 [Camelina sativa]